MLFLINPLFLISFCCQKPVEQHAAPRTEIIGWDRLESPSVNILLMTKLLSLDPLSWDMDCLLTLWPLLIPCSLGNGCCTFGFLIFIIIERNFLYNSLYILTEILKASLHHQSLGLRAFLSLSFSLPLSYHRLWTTRFRSIKGPKVASEQGLWYMWHFGQRDSGPIEVGTYSGRLVLRHGSNGWKAPSFLYFILPFV